MNQFSQLNVESTLAPYHDRIRRVVDAGYAEWKAVKKSMAAGGMAPVLYSRTAANFVFDRIVVHALREFADDMGVHVIQDAQTAKFCFGSTVLLRFKKGDEDNLGQNQPTQAVLDFVYAQTQLPGLPPEAAKVEILYSETELEHGIDSVIVAARDGNNLLWHYEIDGRRALDDTTPFPIPAPIGEDDSPIVTPRLPIEHDKAEGE